MSRGLLTAAFSGVVAIGIIGVAYLLDYAYHYENDEDKARKPDLINKIAQKAEQNCDLQEEFAQSMSYDARLKTAISQTKSQTLDFIINNDITLCLDQRIGKQNNGFFDYTVNALYYPQQKIISIYDNGKDPSEAGFFEYDTTSYMGHLLEEFSNEYSSQDLKYLHSVKFGNAAATKYGLYYEFEEDAENYSVIKNMPELLKPPLR